MFDKHLSAKNEKTGLIVSVQEVIMKIINTFDNLRTISFPSQLFSNPTVNRTRLWRDLQLYCQDAVQSFHWSIAPAILHLFIIYCTGFPCGIYSIEF